MANTGGTKAATAGGSVGTGGGSTVGTTSIPTGGSADAGGSSAAALTTGGTQESGGSSTLAASTGGYLSTGGSNAAMTTGGSLGTGGSSTGGTSTSLPITCTVVGYPMACPALGTVPAGCWPQGTACSTVTTCSDGLYYACSGAGEIYDCATATCVCGPNSAYPVSCPAIGTIPASCWPSGWPAQQ